MDVIQIFIDIFLIILTLYIAFGKSYIVEKGKNLATKEDIGEITKEIETIKNETIYLVQRKSEFHKDCKEIALSFNDSASTFIEYSSDFMKGLVHNCNNHDLLLKYTEDIRIHGAKVTNALLKIFIYYEESSFTESATKYYDATVKIQRIGISILLLLEQYSIKEALLLTSFKSGNMNVQPELLSISVERKKIIEDYIVERRKLLDEEVYKMRGNYIYELSKLLKIKELK